MVGDNNNNKAKLRRNRGRPNSSLTLFEIKIPSIIGDGLNWSKRGFLAECIADDGVDQYGLFETNTIPLQ